MVGALSPLRPTTQGQFRVDPRCLPGGMPGRLTGMNSKLMSIIASGELVAARIAVPTESAVAKTGGSAVTTAASLPWNTCAPAACPPGTTRAASQSTA